jgi:hypothetical protein
MTVNDEITVDVKNKGIVSAEMAWSYRIVPFQLLDDQYHFYVDKDDPASKKSGELEILFGKKIILIPKEREVIERALLTHFVKESSSRDTSVKPKAALEVSGKDFVSVLFEEARAPVIFTSRLTSRSAGSGSVLTASWWSGRS